MILLPIALLTILAGTLLLAKFRKEAPGKFFRFISWFFIVVGFILFIGFIAGGICKLKHHVCSDKSSCSSLMMMSPCGNQMGGGMCCPVGMGQGMGHAKCMSHEQMMKCCPEGMSKDSLMKCCPEGMSKEQMMKCCPEGMSKEQMMKCCPERVKSDNVK